ncbi:MAG: type I DNA topoisomerase [Candidatus Paceibacterota bacterium]
MANSSPKKLVIVESPAKEKTISKYLGSGYTVTSSVGHIRDLPKSNKNAVDIEGGFVPTYEIVPAKKKVVEDIKKKSKNADEVLLATDPDREGESIAWHIKEAAELKDPKRIVFNEITEEAVKEALKHPKKIDEDLKEAQEARRVLDRLFGYDLSAFIWKKVRYGLSAGRVQSPALRILAEREREIEAFIPQTYWVITADMKTEGKEDGLFKCSKEPTEKEEVDRIVKEAENGQWFVSDIKEKNIRRRSRPPFITSTLQQAASSRLGFAPSKTMSVAQRLYEAGLITYMRTDSTALSSQAQAQIKKVVEKEFGSSLYTPKTFKKKSKNAQEAHEAIRPTNALKRTAGTTPEQKRLYKLIWQRTVASQMQDAEMKQTKIIADIKGSNIPYFYINGKRVISEGWLKADPEARSEDTEVPKVEINQTLKLLKVNTEEKETQPPSRYSEAGLVKELEKRGIGRPSTYASIIKTLQDRQYVEKINKSLKPTDTGMVVSSFLEEHFNKYINDSFTAQMEDDLDNIAHGEKKYQEILEEFYKPFRKDISSKESMEKITNLGKADQKHRCPKCGGDMIIKLGRGGKFLSCAKFPDCDGALTIEGKEINSDTPLGEHTETGENIYLLTGRYGPYVQLGENDSKKEKPKRASLPAGKDPEKVSLEDAEMYLSLPRTLGQHPEDKEPIKAGSGRFGPYVFHNGVYASLKKDDDVYSIEMKRALELLKEKKQRQAAKKNTKKGEK